jgi:hypothetical protein
LFVTPGAKIDSFGFAMPTEQIIAQDKNDPERDTMLQFHGSYHHNAASHKNPSKRNYHNESPKNINARYHPTNKTTSNGNQPNNDLAQKRHQNKHAGTKPFNPD